jgi:hypothetical protein
MGDPWTYSLVVVGVATAAAVMVAGIFLFDAVNSRWGGIRV